MRFLEVIRSIDWVAAAASLLLVGLGLAMFFSATENPGLASGLFIRQGVSLAVALIVFFIVAALPYHFWNRYALPTYGLGLAGLILVAVFGATIRGTVSRLEFFGVQIQPSEFMKVAVVIVLAWLFAKARHIGWLSIGTSLVLVAVPAALILLEPDLGVAVLLIVVLVGLLLFLGLPWRVFAILAGAGAVAFVAAWRWLFAEYQKARILTFLDPASDPLGAGYNVVQSIVALGSGQLFGRGLGHGPQSQLKFLPERHTDFILSSIGEELGFVGVVLVLALYLILLWRILAIAKTTQDRFGQLVAVGAFLLLLVSLTVSAGMNMGLLPVTGIPLPLVSFGGSNLVTTFFLLGCVQSVRVYSKWKRKGPIEISHI